MRREKNSMALWADVVFEITRTRKGTTMLNWALTFLVVALIAGVLGFGGIAGEAAWIANVLFVVFLILFLFSAIAGRRGPPIT